MLWALPFLLLVFVGLWGYVSSNMIIKIPRMPPAANPKSFGYDFEPFSTLTEDEIKIEGWIVPSKTKTGSTIVVLHGWGANRSDVLLSTIFLAQHYHLVYFDFRNHGTSGGSETSLTCSEIKDFSAVIRFLKTEKKVYAENIAAFGFSMGAAVALSGAARIQDIKAVIAESPFSSFNDTVARFAGIFFGVPRFAVPLTLIFTRLRLGFDPEECSPIYHIAKISPRPVFIIQAGGDVRMPPSEGQSLFEMAREPKELWLVPQADHGTIFEKEPEQYQKRILGFYQKWLKN